MSLDNGAKSSIKVCSERLNSSQIAWNKCIIILYSITDILAHQIRTPDILSWVRKSYLTHDILSHLRAVHWLYWNMAYGRQVTSLFH